MDASKNHARRLRGPVVLALAAISIALAPLGSKAADAYVLTYLGTLPGGVQSYATALNNSGQVVGTVQTPSTYYPVLYSGTGSNNLNLGVPSGAAGDALDINDAGQIVGDTYIGHYRATLFSGTGSNNTVLYPVNGTYIGIVCAINSSGVSVGVTDDYPDFLQHATIFGFAQGSSNTMLASINNNTSIAYAINAGGTIVGSSSYPGITSHATRFTGDGSPFDLGALGSGSIAGNNSYAFAVNDAGTIVGGATSTPGGSYHAVIYSGTGTGNTDLGTLGGANCYAYGINNSGLIVGDSQFDGSGVFHAFIYKNGVMTDLNTIIINQAGTSYTGIRINPQGGSPRLAGHCVNDLGQIVASSQYGAALLLTPYVLHATSVTFNGTSFTVTFNAIAGKTYRLEERSDLTSSTWQGIAGVNDLTAAATGLAQITDPNGGTAGQVFYRIRLLP